MKKQNAKKIKGSQLINLVLCIILFFIIAFLGRFTSESLLFYINMIMAFYIIGVAQFSLFSVITLISNYMLANIFMVFRTGTGYGLLGMSSKIYMNEINIIILILNISILVWISCSKLLIRERVFLANEVGISVRTCKAMAFLALIMAYIAFPSFQFGITANRFQSLLPGHFWNHFMVVFMIIALFRIKDSLFVKFCLVIITAWVLFHGERVDIIGIYLFLIIRLCVLKNYRINLRFLVRFGVLFIAMFVLFVYIGETRQGGEQMVNAALFASSVLSQGTASDVGFVLNSAIDYMKYNQPLMGRTYITYVQGIIPLIDQPMRAGHIIQNIYHTAGGDYILIEPLMNFGFIGIVAILNLALMCIYIFLKKLSTYKVILYFFLVATSFRYVWYGLSYIETGILYLIPIAYCIAFTAFRNKRPLFS